MINVSFFSLLKNYPIFLESFVCICLLKSLKILPTADTPDLLLGPSKEHHKGYT